MVSEPSPPSGAEAGTGFERLHPLSWLFQLAAQVRSLIVPAIVYLVAGEGSGLRFVVLVFMVPALLQPVVRYLTYRYRLGSEEMVVREGLLFRNERRIQYGRIQNVDLVQNPLHRLFGVALVRIETASGSKPEAVMRVLSLTAIGHLRRQIRTATEGERLAASEPSGEPAAGSDPSVSDGVPALTIEPPRRPARTTLLEMPAVELVKIGLISNRGWVAVGGVMALLWQQDLFSWERLAPEQLAAWLPGLVAERVDSLNPADRILLAAAGLVAVVSILYLLSIGLAFLRFYGFRLELRGNDLRSELGLLTRVAMTTPRRRIQRLVVERSPLHRLFGRATIRVDTAGGAGSWEGGEDGGATGKRFLAPLVEAERTESLIEAALPEVELPQVTWLPIARRAWRRLFRVGLAVLVPVALALSLLTPWALLLLAAGGPWLLLAAHRYIDHRHYALTDQALIWRAGWWTKQLTVVRYSKIQAVVLSRSPFDRRAGMASVQVDTAGVGLIGHGIDIPFLDLETAREIVTRLHREAAKRRFDWR